MVLVRFDGVKMLVSAVTWISLRVERFPENQRCSAFVYIFVYIRICIRMNNWATISWKRKSSASIRMWTIEQPLSLSTWNLVSPLSQLSNRKPRIWKHQKTFLILIWQLTDIPCKGGWGGDMWKWHRCICSATRGVSHRRTWERKLWGSSVIGDDCNYTKQPEINVGRRTNKTTCPLPPSCESISCSPSGSSPAKLSESVQLDQFQGGLFESKYLDRLEYQGWQLEAWDELVRTMVLKQSLDCNLGENDHWYW